MNNYQICTRCIMDTTDQDIHFDSLGVCNHCRRYDEELPKRVFKGENAKEKLAYQIRKIKKSKRNNYDCVIGVSGGVDSTYVAYVVKKLGLNPLAIHFDNGWNSELAVNNIQKTLEKLEIDLVTYVVDWNEFKDLQMSFLKASTPDGEIPTDHAIYALLFQEAAKRNIKYVISGMNFTSESINVPSWAYGHSDWKYIKGVHKMFGEYELKSYPHYTFYDLFYWTYIKRIKVFSILNYIEYRKDHAMEVLKNELDWIYYGGKHYESIYTRFYQGYILPNKFKIDKRRGHLSDLINSKQITREEALAEINIIDYNNEMFQEDLEYVLKKFNLSYEDFQNIMNLPIKSHEDYPNNKSLVLKIKFIVNFLRNIGLYTK